jgi:hypothetical protein
MWPERSVTHQTSDRQNSAAPEWTLYIWALHDFKLPTIQFYQCSFDTNNGGGQIHILTTYVGYVLF